VEITFRKCENTDTEVNLKELTPKENSELTDNLVADYLHKIGNIPVLKEQEEIILLEGASHQELKSIQQLVISNLKLAAKEAIRYSRISGMEVADLIQEGNKGLFNAIDKFSPTYGTKFSTYAIWWIRQAITRYIANHSRTVRVPSHIHGCIGKVSNTRKAMTRELGRSPTLEEIAQRLEESVELIDDALRLSQPPVSLEAPVGSTEPGEHSHGDFICGMSEYEPENASRRGMLQEAILTAIEDLSDSEQFVIKHRFGLYDNREWTLEQIGDKIGVTRERIRQIEVKAISKLRHPSRSRFLRDFHED
jgi:RNA polymerase primary sigma factor